MSGVMRSVAGVVQWTITTGVIAVIVLVAMMMDVIPWIHRTLSTDICTDVEFAGIIRGHDVVIIAVAIFATVAEVVTIRAGSRVIPPSTRMIRGTFHWTSGR